MGVDYHFSEGGEGKALVAFDLQYLALFCQERFLFANALKPEIVNSTPPKGSLHAYTYYINKNVFRRLRTIAMIIIMYLIMLTCFSSWLGACL